MNGSVAMSYVIKDSAEWVENIQVSIWNTGLLEGKDA